MRRLSSVFKYGLIALVLMMVSFGVARAADSQKIVTQDKDNTYNGFFVRSGSIVRLNGTINGDVFLAGEDVTLAGRINGNVYAAAKTISIKGEVTGSVHLAAMQVDISAPVDGTGLIAASSLTVSKEGSLGRGLVGFATTMDISGKVGGPVYIAASTLSVTSEISGPATIAAEQISLSGDGKFGSDLKYYSRTSGQVSQDRVAGTLSYVKSEQSQKVDVAGKATAVVFGLLASFLLGLVMLYIAPKSMVAVADYIQSKPLVALLAGFGFVILVPIALIFVFITIVGIPLMIVVGLLYGAIIMVGELFTALWLGRLAMRTTETKIGTSAIALGLGLIILAILKLIPVVGVVVALVSFFAGVGALVARSFGRVGSVRQAQFKN